MITEANPKPIPMKRLAFIIIAYMVFLPFTARADLVLPVEGPVTSGIGWRLDPLGSGRLDFHGGIDIAVPVGTQVRVTRPGRVVFAGEHGGYGATVIVEHDGGDRTLYGHNMRLAVKEGQKVAAGAVVALSGNTGRSTGPHVHYEMLPRGRSSLDKVLAADAQKSYAVSELETRLRQDQQLDAIMENILKHARSPMLIGNPEREG